MSWVHLERFYPWWTSTGSDSSELHLTHHQIPYRKLQVEQQLVKDFYLKTHLCLWYLLKREEKLIKRTTAQTSQYCAFKSTFNQNTKDKERIMTVINKIDAPNHEIYKHKKKWPKEISGRIRQDVLRERKIISKYTKLFSGPQESNCALL